MNPHRTAKQQALMGPTTASEQLVRNAELALTLATVLAAIEILCRTPGWLLVAGGVLTFSLVLFLLAHIVWVDAVLAVGVAWKLGRGAVHGWRATR
jgi:hypothetical protein